MLSPNGGKAWESDGSLANEVRKVKKTLDKSSAEMTMAKQASKQASKQEKTSTNILIGE